MSWGSLSPSAAAAVFASRAEMPIRIAPVRSFNSAQRPVSSSSSSQRASRLGNSALPSMRNVVTTSVSVGGGGLLWRRDRGDSSPLPLAGEGGSRSDPGGGSPSGTAGAAWPHPPPPPPAAGGAGGPPGPPPRPQSA